MFTDHLVMDFSKFLDHGCEDAYAKSHDICTKLGKIWESSFLLTNQ